MKHVEHLRWPSQAAEREALAHRGMACLLLVEDNADAPATLGPLEDWLRVPAPARDITVRSDQLANRLGASRDVRPELDADGVLRVGDRWQAIPPVEGSLMAVLIDSFGSVVSRDDLVAAAWPGIEVARNALDVRILRLRRRVEPLGLAVRTIRSRGYLLEFEEA